MKRYFITGLAVIMPVIITIVIINFFITFLTKPFLGFAESLLPFENPHLTLLISQAMILLVLFFLVILVGLLGQWFLLNAFFRTFDKIMHKIPLVNKVYKAVQDVMHTLFSKDAPSFSKPVQLPFPHPGSNGIGFIANETVVVEGIANELSTVYVPGAPNPIMGFVFLMPKDSVTPITLTPEETVKFIVSCGLIK